MSFSEGYNVMKGALDQRKERKQEESSKKTIEAYNSGGLDAAIKAASTKEDLDTINTITSLQKNTNDIKNYEPPPVKRKGDLLAEATKAGIDTTQIDINSPGGSTKLAAAFKQREQEKQQMEYDWKSKFEHEKTANELQATTMKKGMELSGEEKMKLISAKQGLESVQIAKDMLDNVDFQRAVFQSAGGSIGRLATWGNTALRKYNTAITESITNLVFAKSGASSSDNEKKAFNVIYGLQAGDTLDVGKFKNVRLNRFFEMSNDILDPNKIAGLTVQQMNEKMQGIQAELAATGGKNDKAVTTIMNGIKSRIVGIQDPSRGGSANLYQQHGAMDREDFLTKARAVRDARVKARAQRGY